AMWMPRIPDPCKAWLIAVLASGWAVTCRGEPEVGIPPPQSRRATGDPVARASQPTGEAAPPDGPPRAPLVSPPPASPPSLLDPNVRPIDLNTALRLAGVQNPDLLLAQQRVVEAAALRQLAAAQFLPTLNGGTNYDSHTGVLQQSNGNILSV